MMEDPKKPRKRSARFRDVENLHGLVDDVPALIFSESRTGCGAVMIPETSPNEGDEVVVQIGRVGKARGRVRWRKTMDADVVKIGIEYI